MTARVLHEAATADHELLSHDLTVLEEMVARAPDYLMAEATHWDLGKNRPPLTLGGILMRRRRLGLLAGALSAAERDHLAAADARYDLLLAAQPVRLESRAVAEIGDRLREWTVYLRDLAASSRLAADHAHYVAKADTRVIIEELVAALGSRRPQQLPDDVAALDNRLRARWQPGEFIWVAVWQPAYPAERYWWLYGTPAPH